jgi:hypothetical protein
MINTQGSRKWSKTLPYQGKEPVMNTIFEKLGGTYHDENGYLIPNLIPPETPQIGAWGRRYLHHLKTEKRVLYTQLLFHLQR